MWKKHLKSQYFYYFFIYMQSHMIQLTIIPRNVFQSRKMYLSLTKPMKWKTSVINRDWLSHIYYGVKILPIYLNTKYSSSFRSNLLFLFTYYTQYQIFIYGVKILREIVQMGNDTPINQLIYLIIQKDLILF